MKKKVLLIVFSNLKHDARMMRHVNFLKDEYLLSVLCLDAAPSEEYRIIRLPKHTLTLFHKAVSGVLLLLRLYPVAYRVLYPYLFLKEKLEKESFDLIIANDVETLPLAFKIANKKSKVLFDAHEYAPRHFENVFTWRLFFQRFNIYLCKKYIPKVNAMVTIGRKISEEYEKHFGVLPTIITNAPNQQSLTTTQTGSKIQLVHHGIGTPSRKIEVMIETMRQLPDHFELNLILITPPSASENTKSYIQYLKSLAEFTNRIHFIPPVTSDKILPIINQYDIGIISIPPVNFNYENTLPNKFFDCIQARLALAIGPTPEMAAIVKEYNLGVISEDFSAEGLATVIKGLTPNQIQQFKKNTEKAAVEFSAEKNKEIFLNIINKVLNE